MKQTDPQESEVLSVEDTKEQIFDCIVTCEVDTSYSRDGDDNLDHWVGVNNAIVESLHRMKAIPSAHDILPERSQLVVCRYEEENPMWGGIFFTSKRSNKNLLDALPNSSREDCLDRPYFGVIAYKDGSVTFCRSYGGKMITPYFARIEKINKNQLKFVNTLINAWLE
ncbi:MAG: hypothetical protein UR96_C0029G0005 [candidate division WS6 bacterium GW2011_GWC1_36_11]|uniref:Uncharacterized protein n=2 Tax=Candidatus Dojkabacteria TaxID=74243 RepID=A0A0G0DRN7_9BACT|nr:MAG: hypothetical protein UR96_C0029G0005 [candidate division WS6 bacterium GW2011_GWC1_36_11]KKQ11830.1 MAG: hypothetical protein US24_C0013G0002 [candidate division WS6 bacterium GW2011_GWC2_36_7]HAM37716.1 hypothetical protein [Patescibacteria group bacterium]HAM96610.1 hypothetical protein [Patescibacteria group bacterium]